MATKQSSKSTGSATGRTNREPMSAAHKKALSKGREEGRAVRSYLEALELQKPGRGRKRTAESIQKRLVAIDAALPGANALSRLQLVQDQKDLEDELLRTGEAVDLSELEKGFIKVAATYGTRKSISYPAWREVGVSASVLQAAGIRRARG